MYFSPVMAKLNFILGTFINHYNMLINILYFFQDTLMNIKFKRTEFISKTYILKYIKKKKRKHFFTDPF